MRCLQTAQQAYEGRVHDKNMLQSTVSVGTHVRRFSSITRLWGDGNVLGFAADAQSEDGVGIALQAGSG